MSAFIKMLSLKIMGKILLLIVASSGQQLPESLHMPADAVTGMLCAQLSQMTNEGITNLPQSNEKVHVVLDNSKAFVYLMVMKSCFLTVFDDSQGLEVSQSFPEGTYQNISGLIRDSFFVYYCHCKTDRDDSHPKNETDYKKFLRQHLGPASRQFSNSNCDSEIKKRCILASKNRCKETNTFIHTTAKKLKSVCNQPANIKGLHKSDQQFSLTVCNLHSNQMKKPCKYRAVHRHSRIIVGCNNKMEPVHFEGDSP
ncbi:uncharacterized protein LOC122808681 [Protopterus annectens]|uniref:uncharacterized protein LOC122808681 n=1 Tax=Protopterus annectens TaxID=7888 RepID=UPI001CFBD224|nr:uncharacterized protein LOC122808681 [Protopterus annectens]